MAGQGTRRRLQTLPVLVVVEARDGAVVVQCATVVAGLRVVPHRVRPQVPGGGRGRRRRRRSESG